ncbi:MAG: S-layer homology domain-containing protein, partial [Firmicutes bacterium]|nr:S-layer homology domain-containing protein [Bacillota bacterium]
EDTEATDETEAAEDDAEAEDTTDEEDADEEDSEDADDATADEDIVTNEDAAFESYASFVGKVNLIEAGYANIELADGSLSVSETTDGINEGDYIILSYTANGDYVSTVSSWFYEEFSGTDINFSLVQKSDYTEAATRLDFAETIYSYLASKDLISAAEQANPFIDTDSDAVNALNAAGIINGVSDNEFAPESALTREAAATIIARAYFYANPNAAVPEVAPVYDDNDEISDWAAESVNQLFALNMMTGSDDNKFMPQSELTLEQALAVILRSNLDAAEEIIDTDTNEDTDTDTEDTELENPVVEYSTVADLNAAIASFGVADLSDTEGYTAAYSLIDNTVAQIVYTSDSAVITIRKAVQTDAAANDISGVEGAEAAGTFEVTDTAKVTGEETIEVSLSTYENSTVAVWALDDADVVYNFSLVIDSEDEVSEDDVKAIVQNVIDTTPRG